MFHWALSGNVPLSSTSCEFESMIALLAMLMGTLSFRWMQKETPNQSAFDGGEKKYSPRNHRLDCPALKKYKERSHCLSFYCQAPPPPVSLKLHPRSQLWVIRTTKTMKIHSWLSRYLQNPPQKFRRMWTGNEVQKKWPKNNLKLSILTVSLEFSASTAGGRE